MPAGFVHSIYVAYFWTLTSLKRRARAVRMVQCPFRMGGDEIARSDGQQSECLRHAAVQSRLGWIKGRYSGKASLSLWA